MAEKKAPKAPTVNPNKPTKPSKKPIVKNKR